MSENKADPPAEKSAQGQRWFEKYCKQLNEKSVYKEPKAGVRYACPCCKYLTLSQRGGFELCPVCFWEDDGQDDHDAQIVRGGPNGKLSLEQARKNFAAFGASEQRRKVNVRPPESDEMPM